MTFHSRTSCIATLLANGPEFALPLYLNARPETVQVSQVIEKGRLITQHIAAFGGKHSFCRGTARRAFFCMVTFRPLNIYESVTDTAENNEFGFIACSSQKGKQHHQWFLILSGKGGSRAFGEEPLIMMIAI